MNGISIEDNRTQKEKRKKGKLVRSSQEGNGSVLERDGAIFRESKNGKTVSFHPRCKTRQIISINFKNE